jgi:hypothetical protein
MSLDKISYWNMINSHRDLATHHRALTAGLYAQDCHFNAGAPVDHCAGREAVLAAADTRFPRFGAQD